MDLHGFTWKILSELAHKTIFKMAFFISPMGSFQGGMQIVKNWYGGQLDASLDSGHI